jgi:hypothetical protein
VQLDEARIKSEQLRAVCFLAMPVVNSAIWLRRSRLFARAGCLRESRNMNWADTCTFAPCLRRSKSESRLKRQPNMKKRCGNLMAVEKSLLGKHKSYFVSRRKS